MDNIKEEKKQIQLKIQSYFKKIEIENFASKSKANGDFCIIKNKEEIASISFRFLSPRYSSLGVNIYFTMNFYIFKGCLIYDKIMELNLDIYLEKNKGFPFGGTYEFPKTSQYPEGRYFNFYNTISHETRINELFEYIEDDIIYRMNNYLNYKLKLVEDVLTKPNYYLYPLTTIIICLCLNNKIEEIENYIRKAESLKLYDAKPVFIEILINKLEQQNYFRN